VQDVTEVMPPEIYVIIAKTFVMPKSWSTEVLVDRFSDTKTGNSDIYLTYASIYVTSSNQYNYSGKLIPISDC
jgi:hypothetical protein